MSQTALPPGPLPEPMTAPDCDLRGMPYMPLDITRLFDSDLYILSTGDEFKAALSLWAKSFLQVPAGSLPDDARILAHLSGAGPAWPGLSAMALHGWIRCSDGRLYHRTVAQKAREAWAVRRAHRARTAAATAARLSRDPPPPASRDEPAAPDVTSHVTLPKGREGNGKEESGSQSFPRPGASCRDERGTRLAEDWQPGPGGLRFALALGLDAEAVLAEFRRYWCARAGREARKVNWEMTWQNWCTRAAREAGEGRRRSPRAGPTAWLHEAPAPLIDGDPA